MLRERYVKNFHVKRFSPWEPGDITQFQTIYPMKKSNKSKISTKNLGGYHPDPTVQKWKAGSIWECEGKKLYDIIQEQKPKLVVEIGGFFGCSTAWIALALRDLGGGKVISIDNQEYVGGWGQFPEDLKEFVEFIVADARTVQVPKNIDMVFEDGAHTPGFTAEMIKRFKPRKVWVSHDYMHKSKVGQNVKKDIDEAFGSPDEIFFENEETDCGLAIKYFDQDVKNKN